MRMVNACKGSVGQEEERLLFYNMQDKNGWQQLTELF